MSRPSQGSEIQDTGDLKKYRTETPNLIYELRLTPFECALYNHFKRVAGAGPNGQCYRSTERLAEETGMSPGMISKAKKGLLRTDRPGLNGKALIHIEKDESRPGRPRDVVTIVDIWPENFLFFAHQSSPQSSYSELQSSPQSSPGEPKNKKDSKKENSKKESEETLNVSGGQDAPYKTDDLGESVPREENGPTLNAPQTDLENLFSEQAEADEPPAKASSTATAPGAPKSPASGLKALEIERVVQMTGDETSRRRWEQMYDFADQEGLLTVWDQARKATRKAVLKAQEDKVRFNAGKYFNGLAAKLLNEAHPGLIPTGTKEERLDVKSMIRDSLAAAGGGTSPAGQSSGGIPP